MNLDDEIPADLERLEWSQRLMELAVERWGYGKAEAELRYRLTSEGYWVMDGNVYSGSVSQIPDQAAYQKFKYRLVEEIQKEAGNRSKVVEPAAPAEDLPFPWEEDAAGSAADMSFLKECTEAEFNEMAEYGKRTDGGRAGMLQPDETLNDLPPWEDDLPFG